LTRITRPKTFHHRDGEDILSSQTHQRLATRNRLGCGFRRRALFVPPESPLHPDGGTSGSGGGPSRAKQNRVLAILLLYTATLDGHPSDHTIGHRGEGASGKPIPGSVNTKKSCRENKKSRDINEESREATQ
jgi:hypothetical protein